MPTSRPPEPTRLERLGEFASRAASLRPADPRLRRALYAAIGLVVLLCVALAAVGSTQELSELDHGVDPAWLSGGIVGFAAYTLLGAELWRRLLLALGEELPPRPAFAIWCTSSLGRYVPTSVMMPVMRMAMAEREGVPKRLCLASMVYELVFGLSAALCVGAYFVIDHPSLGNDTERFAAVVLPVAAFVALQPPIFRPVANGVLRRLGREELPFAMGGMTVVRFLGLFIVFYVLAGLSVYALGRAIYPLDAGALPVVVGGFAASSALSLLAFVFPSGLIAREAALVLILKPVMATSAAIALAVLVRLVQIAMELVMSVVTSVIWRRGAIGAADTPTAAADGLE